MPCDFITTWLMMFALWFRPLHGADSRISARMELSVPISSQKARREPQDEALRPARNFQSF
jgi:hypothetical protein